MKAKRGGYCGRCGAWAAAGNDLERVYDAIEDEDVWVVYHTDRSICERNIAEAKAREMARDAFRGALRALESRFLVEGTLPDQAEPRGEVLHDTFSIYGAGIRFQRDEQTVWYVQANGMDGDDWSRNNCLAGIARSLPRAAVEDDLSMFLAAEAALPKE